MQIKKEQISGVIKPEWFLLLFYIYIIIEGMQKTNRKKTLIRFLPEKKKRHRRYPYI